MCICGQKIPQELFKALLADVSPNLTTLLSGWSHEQIIQGITLFKERVSTLSQLVDQLHLVHNGPTEYNQSDIEKWIQPETLDYLQVIINSCEEQPEVFESAERLSALVTDISKRLGVKLVTLAQPIRIALVGSSEGPGVFALMALVGRERTISAITALWNVVMTARRNHKE